MVEHVLRLDPDLSPVSTHWNRAEERGVQVPVAGPAELVAAAVTPRRPDRLRECGRVVPLLVRSSFTETRLGIPDYVDGLKTPGLLKAAVGSADREDRKSGV